VRREIRRGVDLRFREAGMTKSKLNMDVIADRILWIRRMPA
jgi:hypothetical protein